MFYLLDLGRLETKPNETVAAEWTKTFRHDVAHLERFDVVTSS
jgi:hypothetical protein